MNESFSALRKIRNIVIFIAMFFSLMFGAASPSLASSTAANDGLIALCPANQPCGRKCRWDGAIQKCVPRPGLGQLSNTGKPAPSIDK
jgi:hypothetical protein